MFMKVAFYISFLWIHNKCSVPYIVLISIELQDPTKSMINAGMNFRNRIKKYRWTTEIIKMLNLFNTAYLNF